MTLNVTWHDHGRFAQNPPNPNFPEGVDLDISHGSRRACFTKLPYPAPRCGLYVVACDTCGTNAGITTAGRPDDPRSVKLPCKVRSEPRQ